VGGEDASPVKSFLLQSDDLQVPDGDRDSVQTPEKSTKKGGVLHGGICESHKMAEFYFTENREGV